MRHVFSELANVFFFGRLNNPLSRAARFSDLTALQGTDVAWW